MFSWFKPSKSRPFILALGAGGGRGMAHLGVLEVLEEHGLRPSAIVGTSIGALFGSMYALDPDIKRVEQHLMDFLESDEFKSLPLPTVRGKEVEGRDWLDRLTSAARKSVIYSRSIRRTSVVSGEVLIQSAKRICHGKSFEDTEIPMHVVAVRYPHGDCHVFSKGNLSLSIAASMAIPGVFDPIEVDGSLYVDGGLSSEIPVMEARSLAQKNDLIVAVNTGSRPDPANPPRNVFEMVDWAMQVKSLYLRRYERAQADILVQPLVGATQWQDFSSPEQEIEKGRDAALEIMPALMKALS